MNLRYVFLDEDYQPSSFAVRRINKDMRWMQKSIQLDIGGGVPICLIDGAEFECPASERGAWALGYVTRTRRIHKTDGVTIGVYTLPKPLEELTVAELQQISREYASTALRLDMLKKLQELANDQKT